MMERFQNQGLNVDGLSFKRMYHPTRDVDYNACIRLLLKFGAEPQLASPSGKLPIFKVIKCNLSAMQMVLEFDKNREKTVNLLNKRHMSPLCKLARKEESEENHAKITLLINAKATCLASLPDHHPLYMALYVHNMRAVRSIFLYTDALRALNNFNRNQVDPLLIGFAKSKDFKIFMECMKEWTKWVKINEPENFKFLSVKLKDKENFNIMHIIAQNQSLEMLEAMFQNTMDKNDYTNYTERDLHELMS